MGAGASSMDDLPKRVTLKDIHDIMDRLNTHVAIDTVRFNAIQDTDGYVTRLQALQLIENKQPKIPFLLPKEFLN